MPESSLIFTGEFDELLHILLEGYIEAEQLEKERTYLEGLKSLCDTKDWFKSSCQIFSDSHLLEVMMINPLHYKLYAEKWENPEENPFPFIS